MSTASDDHGPLLGALLRLTHRAIIQDIARGLEEGGYADVTPPHFAVTQALWDRPDGIRLTELAARVGVTKQSMGALVDELEAAGYVARSPDPTDGRASVIGFTSRGWALGRAARAQVRKAEARFAKRVGARRIEQLKETLRMMLADPGA